jgi:hypothetical protein
MNRRWPIRATQDRTDGDGQDIGQQMLPCFQGTEISEKLKMGARRGQPLPKLSHFAASMQSTSRAGPDAGPEQTGKLISNTQDVGGPVAINHRGYTSSRASPCRQPFANR